MWKVYALYGFTMVNLPSNIGFKKLLGVFHEFGILLFEIREISTDWIFNIILHCLSPSSSTSPWICFFYITMSLYYPKYNILHEIFQKVSLYFTLVVSAVCYFVETHKSVVLIEHSAGWVLNKNFL